MSLIHTSMCIYVYLFICSHMRQNVLATNHTVSRYIYIYITSITPGVPWVNRTNPFGWLVQRFRGGRRAPGSTGERWGFTEDGGFQWWICLEKDFQSFKVKRSKNMKISTKYKLNVIMLERCLIFTIYHLPPPTPNLMKMSSGGTVDRSFILTVFLWVFIFLYSSLPGKYHWKGRLFIAILDCHVARL